MLNLQHLSEILERNRPAATAQVKEFTLNGKTFSFNSRPYLMGVINLSPDSWYRESVCLSVESTVNRALVLQSQGADIIDIGAESTLEKASRVSSDAQKKKLLPIIRQLARKKLIVSIETYSPAVALAALKEGASVINLTGSEKDSEIFRMAADHEAAVILCYVQGKNVREVGDFDFSQEPLLAMQDYFSKKIEMAERCRLKRLIIDPGLGFYYRNLSDSTHRVRHQMEVFLNTFRLRSLGYPICHALPHAFEFFQEEVRSAEPFFAVLAALGGAHLFRTHEIPKVKAVLDTLGAWKAD